MFNLVVDLRADWAPFLGATDGAQIFGYGGCWAKVSPESARRVAAAGSSVESKKFPYDVLGAGAEGPLDCVLPCTRADFRTTFSIKCNHDFHASKLEIRAFSLFLRHLARSARWHGRRVTILADSMATFLCAKGSHVRPQHETWDGSYCRHLACMRHACASMLHIHSLQSC